MLNLVKTSKIFVMCPGNVTTGGAELLHQLVDLLNRNDKLSYIVYYGDNNLPYSIPNEYQNYLIHVASEIEDEEQNIVVFYEALFNKIFDFHLIQKVLWWLSVDNFFTCSWRFLSPSDLFKFNKLYGTKLFFYRILLILVGKNTFKSNIKLSALSQLDVINAYQSEYAKDFLEKNGFNNLNSLSDYINTEFAEDPHTGERRNVILYNPKKGLEFTKHLIRLDTKFKYTWIPIQNLNRIQIKELFSTSKLYIDFGFHPGKDRLPREAVLNGCCVITSLDGSARFHKDVPIKKEYKFEKSLNNLMLINKKIDYIMENYNSCYLDFEDYRTQVLNEKSIFEEQVKVIFKI